jgi:hypothetical protein
MFAQNPKAWIFDAGENLNLSFKGWCDNSFTAIDQRILSGYTDFRLTGKIETTSVAYQEMGYLKSNWGMEPPLRSGAAFSASSEPPLTAVSTKNSLNLNPANLSDNLSLDYSMIRSDL